MNIFSKTTGHLISVPARIKGMKFGKNSFIGPGYALAPLLKGVELGKNVVVGRNAWFDISRSTKGGRIAIGNRTQIGRNAVLSACKNISIGKKCLLSYNVTLVDHDHDVFDPNIAPMDAGITGGKEIFIEDECFIGAHSFILKGVRLGKHCVVGANSVVTKSFPACSVIAGSPAKLIRTLEEKETYGKNPLNFRDNAGA
ncbi:MAG: DapH/DapD/GlmU-related protein [Candidatus Moranbacteria bacterium]|nr:DapH/DapD/GlmU-related protein [Candidatus Moranbacteria bacterium]